MTKEEINAKIKAVEEIKAFYESERDVTLGTIAVREKGGLYGAVDEYLHYAREVELLERELKRLHTDRAEIVLHGDES